MKKKRVSINWVLIIVIVISLLPFLIMILGSFKTNTSLLKIPPDFSLDKLNVDNYVYVFKKGIVKPFINSLIISLLTTIIVIIVDSLAGYVFARKDFYGKKVLFYFLLGTMMIPKQILMVPTFIMLVKIGIYDSLLGTILSSAAIPFGVFLIKQRMEELPKDIFDAAELDGSSEFQKYIKIALPLSLNSILSLALFVFVQIWNDFMWQLITLSSKNNITIPLFISNLIAEKTSMIAYQFASSVIATIPIIIIFIKFNKHFIVDSTGGSLKE